MSMALSANLVSGSIDASLNEIERRSHNLGQDPANELTIGPFSVLHFPVESEETSQACQPRQIEDVGLDHTLDVETVVETPTGTMTAEMPIPGPHISLPESLGYMDEFLHWSDILDVEFDQTDFSAWPTSTIVNPCHFGPEDSNLFSLRADELGFDLGGGDIPCEQSSQKDLQHLAWTTQRQQTVVNSLVPSPDVIINAPFLLKNLREKVIVLMEAMPLGRKSPWKMMNMQAAVVTLGDLTFLNSQNIAHARLANLYGLLACSAFHLTLNLPNDTDRSIDHWKDITNQAFEQAKGHMQNSLKNETQVPKKVKYKDQLMALSTLTEFAVS